MVRQTRVLVYLVAEVRHFSIFSAGIPIYCTSRNCCHKTTSNLNQACVDFACSHNLSYFFIINKAIALIINLF